MRAVFLDKDGTLIHDVPYAVDPKRIKLMPRACAGLQRLQNAGYRFVVVTNQSGVARGYFGERALGRVEETLRVLLARNGIDLSGFYYCPHHPDGSVPRYARLCECRKPQPGLLRRAAQEHALELPESWMIGDILNDIEAGRRAGCRTVLIDNGNETQWQLSRQRLPHHLAGDLDEAARFILAHDGPPPPPVGEEDTRHQP